jgi:glycosyltransferase involved in cell wall biosynthesis
MGYDRKIRKAQATINVLNAESSTGLGHQRKIRIAYLSGPCDAPAVYLEWSRRQQQDYFGTNYMKQFLQLCEDLDAESYVITNLPGQYKQCRMGRFIFDNHPNPSGLTGILWHLAFLPWFARVVPKIIRFKPDVLIATANDVGWFLLFPLKWLRIPILPSFHGVPWRKYGPRKLSSRIRWQLNRLFIMKDLKAVVVTSNDITRQLRDLLGPDMSHIHVARHFPSYPASQFASIPAPDLANRPPFRIIFLGRIETDKGIYDLVEIARRLEAERKGMFHFDICGDGGELEKLRKRVVDLNLENVVSCHGYCTAEKVPSLLGLSHALIVPTRSDCTAGFEMVCAEAILANRPLITSAVCPALEDVQEASIEVEPDNVDQYYQAILKLNDDPELFAEKQAACATLHEPFYNPEKSWATKMKEALAQYQALRPAVQHTQDRHNGLAAVMKPKQHS